MTESPAGVPIWDDELTQSPSPLRGTIEADACVIGLGGSGLECVHALLDLGQRVVGIDSGRVAGGAAGRNGGFLLAGTAQFYHDTAAALGNEAASRWYHATLAELDRFAGRFPRLIQRNGSLRIATSSEEVEDCARQREAMIADGLPVEPYDGPEGGGLLFPLDGSFQPLQRCRRMAEEATARGARLFEATSAVALEETAVGTLEGSIRARHILVLVDGGLDVVCPVLASRVRTARLQMVATEPATDIRLPRPVYARWGYEYFQQVSNGRITLGGFRDQAGEAEWTTEARTTPEVQAMLDAYLRTTVRTNAPVTHRWAACVGFTSDALPIVERLGNGVWVAGGYSGTGNLIGAICGRGLAQLAVTGRAAGLDGLVTNTATDQ